MGRTINLYAVRFASLFRLYIHLYPSLYIADIPRYRDRDSRIYFEIFKELVEVEVNDDS